MMPVVTVSRQRGSMGSYIAFEVAQRLGLRYLDREILDSVAREAGVPPAEVEALEEHAGRLARVLRLLGTRPKLPAVPSASLREQDAFEERVEAVVKRDGLSREAAIVQLTTSGGTEYAARSDYLDLLSAIILECAAEGQAMIVGRGGQMILRGHPAVLHVRIIARFENRVYNIIQREGVKWREAAHRVRLADEQRVGYMRRFYNVDLFDASLYDLVISTDKIPSTDAVEMIIQAAQGVESAAHQNRSAAA